MKGGGGLGVNRAREEEEEGAKDEDRLITTVKESAAHDQDIFD